MLTATTNAPQVLARLNATLAEYRRLSKKTGRQIIQQKLAQFVLGVGQGTAKIPGIFDQLARLAPKEGQVSAERAADSFRLGRASSTSVRWAHQRAAELLEGQTAGVFRIGKSSAGTREAVRKVARGQIFAKGKRLGQLTFGRHRAQRTAGRTLKTAVAATGSGRQLRGLRAYARQAGASLLNLQALAVTLAIARRENSRFATAVQFQPRRYRRVFNPKTLGRQRILQQNKTGRSLGALEISDDTLRPFGRLTGFLGLHGPRAERAWLDTLAAVEADMRAYIQKKHADAFQAAARAKSLPAR